MKKKRTTLSETPVETPVPTEAAAFARDERSRAESFPIVGIGASAGGLEAFTQLLKALPLDTGMGFVLVQHLDPEHESALTQILSRATALPVCDVTNNQPVQPNCVYIIPPDTNLSIAKGLLKLQPRPKTRTPHRPIDSFFESLAADHGERAIGVVLSGTASDGTLGLEAIKAEGGITFAQDDSAKYDSMPRSAVAAGCVDLVLSPKEIAEELARIAKHPYVASGEWRVVSGEMEKCDECEVAGSEKEQADGDASLPSSHSPLATRDSQLSNDGYAKALSLLRTHSGVDFSLYKSGTIQRRITRRLVINKQNTLDDYATFLQGNVKELDALCADLLISVTSFFRNPEAFETLQREVLPKLLKQPGDEPIRVWVPGCSTGQEAYSIAIAFMEAAEKSPRRRNIQVFATDLNEKSLEKARFGLYPKSISDDVNPARLRRFFVEEQGGYRVSKSLREMVVFARQNLFGDPPFSRMDLISCRNLLIYVGASLQKRAIPTFHYALKPSGILLLGASESVVGFTELFELADKKYKIYSRKAAPTPAFHMPANQVRGEWASAGRRASAQSVGQSQQTAGFGGEANAQREADRVTIKQFAPPGVLVNADLQVLQFRGSTGAFLEPPVGKASFDVLKMAREGLMLPLRAAIDAAKKDHKTTRRENVRIQYEGEIRAVHLEVIPLKNLPEICYLILFQDAEHNGRATLPEQPARQPLSKEDEASRIAELETDLAEAREYLQAREEQHERANEELQAASEEIQSANEELQSINEELETSKEELESANEELTTVNDEMSHRNVELQILNNDLVNFQNSTRLIVLLLGRDLTIRRYSPQAEKQFGLLAADVGRPISHIRHNLVHADDKTTPLDLETFCVEVISSASEREREVLDLAGRWHSLRARPYVTSDEKVDGAVLLLLEIDELKQSEQAVAAARDYAENIVATVREPLLVLNSDLRVESANLAFYQVFQVAPAETVGEFIYELGDHQWDIPLLRELLEEILPQRTSIEEFQVEHEFKQLGRRTMLLNARTIQNPLRKTERILLAIEDGAVLIDGDVIEKLGVHLPLSRNLPEVGRSGTRHTAALGLAECCDALVIVVSEERGTFSVAEESRLTAIESVGELKHKLDGFYGRRVQTPKELARRNWLTVNLRLKLLAGATACGLWFLFAYDAETIRRTFHDVPIELRNVPDSWVVHDTFPSVAQVTLSGSERAFAKLNPADLKASIDLSSVRGSADILLTEEHFKVPTGLSLEHLDPPQVQVRTERLVSVDLPVWHAQSAALGVADAKQSAAFSRTPATPFEDSGRAPRTGTQGRRPPGKVELERPKPAIGALRRGAERSESLSAAIRLQWRGEFNGRADCFSGYVSARLLRRIDAESLARNCPIQAPGDQKTINRKRSNACRIPI